MDGVVNVLGVVSRCLPDEQALAIWNSALNQKLVTLEEMRRYPLTARGRDLATRATPLADSASRHSSSSGSDGSGCDSRLRRGSSVTASTS